MLSNIPNELDHTEHNLMRILFKKKTFQPSTNHTCTLQVHLNLRKTREKKATIPRKFRRESIKQADLRNLASLSTTKARILFGNAARESFNMAYTIGHSLLFVD